jgi:TolB-like protein
MVLTLAMGWRPALVCVLLSGAAAYADDRPIVLVLQLEAKGASELEADAAALGVARGLRSLDAFQVLASDDVRRLLALERQRQLMGSGGDASGLEMMSRTLGARYAVAGSVSKLDGKLQVDLRLMDTAGAKVLAQKSVGPVPKFEDLAASLPGLAQELVAGLLATQQGSLIVRAREEGVEILVDDVLVGSTPLREALKLSRGAHRLQVRKDGFIAQAKSVTIAQDQLAEAEFRLVPSADYAEAWKLRHGRLRLGAWAATGVAVASLAGAVILDRLVTEPMYQTEYLPRQYVLRNTVPSKIPAATAAAPGFAATYAACGADPATCAADAKTLKGTLETQQLVTGGLVGLGVIAAGAAGYLWLSGEDPNRYANLVAGVTLGPSPGFALAGRF